MKLPTLDVFRAQLMTWSPALIVFGYIVLFRHAEAGWLDTLLAAAFGAMAVWVIGCFGYYIVFGSLSHLLGRPNPNEFKDVDWQGMIAGVLLATGVWILWQENKATTIDAIAVCVDEQRYELQSEHPSELVKSCYRTVSEPDDSGEQ